MGLQAGWVERGGGGWWDGLVGGVLGRPTAVVKELGEVVEVVRKHSARRRNDDVKTLSYT